MSGSRETSVGDFRVIDMEPAEVVMFVRDFEDGEQTFSIEREHLDDTISALVEVANRHA